MRAEGIADSIYCLNVQKVRSSFWIDEHIVVITLLKEEILAGRKFGGFGGFLQKTTILKSCCRSTKLNSRRKKICQIRFLSNFLPLKYF